MVHAQHQPASFVIETLKVLSGLKTSLERSCERHDIAAGKRREFERRLFREFRRSYHQYSAHEPDRTAVVEWLSLMQHHGAPTRLLDFTYSIYVAAYFATEDKEEEGDGRRAIWALDGVWALNRAASLLRKREKCDQALDQMMRPFQEGDEKVVTPLFFESPYASAVWPINPIRLNQRLQIQRGVFLIPGDAEEPFMTNLEALMDAPDSNDKLLKIVISPEVGREAVRHLFSMGISRTSLFPGLDGFARSLSVWHSVDGELALESFGDARAELSFLTKSLRKI